MRIAICTSLVFLLMPCPLQGQDVPKEITNSIGMKLVLIPKGEFTMGSPETEQYREDDELEHQVTLSGEFYLGVTEVTQSQYEKVMGGNPSYFQGSNVTGDSSSNPVEQVSWDDAVEFCKRLSEIPEEKSSGRVYRLPTEAEWEYSCRAGSKTVFSFGENSKSFREYAHYRGNSNGQTHPVGKKKPNAWGIYDMYGNVCEWCSDGYDVYPIFPMIDYSGPADSLIRVSRGGWASDGAADCRSAARGRFISTFRSSCVGFRVVLSSSDVSATGEEIAKTEMSDDKEMSPEKTSTADNGKGIIREWTSSDGKSKVRGRLLEFNSKEINIERRAIAPC